MTTVDPRRIAAQLGLDAAATRRVAAAGHLARLAVSDAEIRRRLFQAHLAHLLGPNPPPPPPHARPAATHTERRHPCAKSLLLAAAIGAALAASATLASAANAPTCSTDCITEYPVPASGSFGIAHGPGDDMWFSDQHNAIDRIDRHGNVTTYTVPSAGAGISWVTRGTESGMWFTERYTNKLGRIDNLGRITEYTIPTPNSLPQGIAQDANGIVWFTEHDGNNIGRLDPSTRAFTEYAIPTANARPVGLALGPDGALWFTETHGPQPDPTQFALIGRMTKNGSFTEYPLALGSFPQRIIAAPDGALWFTDPGTSTVGRITTTGQLTTYPVDAGSLPVGITAGMSDHALWVAESTAGKIIRMSLDGTITNEYTTPTPSPFQIAAGSNGLLWYTHLSGNTVGKLDPYANRSCQTCV